jgi:hypothetical protein
LFTTFDAAGQTAADVAARSGHSRLASYLKKVAAGTTARPSKTHIPTQLRRQLASAVAQYQQAVTADLQRSGVPQGIAAAAGAIVPLNSGIAVAVNGSSSSASASLTEQAAAVAAQPGVAAGAVAAAAAAATKRLAKAAAQRGWEGVGSQGTQLARGVAVFRVLAVITQVGSGFMPSTCDNVTSLFSNTGVAVAHRLAYAPCLRNTHFEQSKHVLA